jgi:sugar phosphate isomerase/epimerase
MRCLYRLRQDRSFGGRFHGMLRFLIPLVLAAVLPLSAKTKLLDRENLVAWCIVPFDAKKRGPEERAAMLKELGLSRLAYDWRDEHVASFDAEVVAMKRQGIELTAWWMPGALDANARKIIEVIRRHEIHPQWWVMIGEPAGADQAAKVKAAADQLRPLAIEAKALGCKLALYNHGGWFGEPENQLAIIRELALPNVGIVYNFHHGHAHIGRFPQLFDAMKPHLLALNLNGMVDDGEALGKKILPPGDGTRELEMLRHVVKSGWQGPVGILDHLPETDSAVTLRGNLAALDRLAGISPRSTG